MAKVRQRNWLLIITGLLFVTSIALLVFTTKKKMGIGVCYHNDLMYEQNQLIPDYERGSDCYCAWSGEIVCKDTERSFSYEDFSSEGLMFSYTFRNLLEKTSPDFSKVFLADINYKDGVIDIILEREVFCTEEGQVPTQIGMYEKRDDSMILTTVTNIDESIYNRSCIILNNFSLTSLNFSKSDSPIIYYQNESGLLLDLKSCYVGGRFYAPGVVFRDLNEEKLCTCNGPEYDCEPLK